MIELVTRMARPVVRTLRWRLTLVLFMFGPAGLELEYHYRCPGKVIFLSAKHRLLYVNIVVYLTEGVLT